MKAHAEQRQRLVVLLCVVCLGLLPLGPLSAQEPKLRATLKGHTDAVFSVAYSPDGKILASGGGDNTIKLWDVRTGKEQAYLEAAFEQADEAPCMSSRDTARRIPTCERS